MDVVPPSPDGASIGGNALPQDHPGFRSPWRSCPPSTAVRHLDVDSPRLLEGLAEQEESGLFDQRPVQCSSGDFALGDYAAWRKWRESKEAQSEVS
jgi:hypothetical protein